MEIAKRIVFTNRFRKLPSKYDVHEWAIMEKFSYEQRSETVRQDLLNAIHGAGVPLFQGPNPPAWHRAELAFISYRSAEADRDRLVRKE